MMLGCIVTALKSALETLQAFFVIIVILLMYRETTVVVIIDSYKRHHENNHASVITIVVMYLQWQAEFVYSGSINTNGNSSAKENVTNPSISRRHSTISHETPHEETTWRHEECAYAVTINCPKRCNCPYSCTLADFHSCLTEQRSNTLNTKTSKTIQNSNIISSAKHQITVCAYHVNNIVSDTIAGFRYFRWRHIQSH